MCLVLPGPGMAASTILPAHFPCSIQGTPGKSFLSEFSLSLSRKPHQESLPACV